MTAACADKRQVMACKASYPYQKVYCAYCARRDMENRIKECQTAFRALPDSLSVTRLAAELKWVKYT
jgi:hypothetical protein